MVKVIKSGKREQTVKFTEKDHKIFWSGMIFLGLVILFSGIFLFNSGSTVFSIIAFVIGAFTFGVSIMKYFS